MMTAFSPDWHGYRAPDLMELAVLRGVVESDDPGRYFGSFGALAWWTQSSADSGLIRIVEHSAETLPTFVATERGLWLYEHTLKDLPQCRQVFWRSAELTKLLAKENG